LQNHAVCAFNLPVRPRVSDGGPVDSDVVVVTEPEELLPRELVPLSVMMEFGTPKWWMMSMRNFTASSDLIVVIGLTLIHFENLTMAISRCV
jgi:hypothetical protein